jgi:hypothetical protein
VTISGRSMHPVVQLVHELIASGRDPTRTEKRQILDRIASALFSRATILVPRGDRGLLVHGQPIGRRAPSLVYHLAKHTGDGQWTPSTSAHQYVGDLRRGVRARSAELALFNSGPRVMAAVRVPTEDAVPPARRGPEIHPMVLVIYSADLDRILTGFQYESLDHTQVPKDVIWRPR